MALLLDDGFGLYDTAFGAGQAKGWTLTGTLVSGVGRVSTSRYIHLTGSAGVRAVQTFAGFSGATSILGFAFRFVAGSPTLPADVASMSVGGSAVRLVWTTSSTVPRLAVYKDSALVADLGVLALDTWYYLEVRVDWAVAGTVVVRLDGSERYNAAMTLAAPTAGLTVGLRNAFSGTGAIRFTDLLVMDGSGSTFNGFQGDVTIETVFPTADGANSGWTRATPARTVTNKVLTSNVATLTIGTHGYDVDDSVTVAGVDATFNGTYTLTAVGATTVSYAKVAANVSSTAASGTVTYAGTTHWTAVNEAPANNGDTDYVTTSTVDAVDTYAMGNLVSAASSPVLAVRPVLVARKESAAVMSIAPTVRSAGTDYPGTARDLPNTLVYSAESDTLTTDPATAAAWTRSAVDALEVGPKKTA